MNGPLRPLPGGEAAPSGPEDDWSTSDYLRTIRGLLAKGLNRDASELLQIARRKYPDDPFLLSYFGYLGALLDGKYRGGVESCLRAISLFGKRSLQGEEGVDERLNAILYLNLGRTYLAGGKRKEAYDILQKGLRYDRRNAGLLEELKKLGVRKYVPVPFLARSNVINQLVGRMFRRSG